MRWLDPIWYEIDRKKRYKWNFLETPVYCCTFGCIENHWTIEKRRKVSWQKLKNSKHPCFAYLSGRVAYHIALGLFLLFAFLQENIWYLTLLTENSDRKVDTGGLGCNRCSLWHPILLAWTYFYFPKKAFSRWNPPGAALAHGHGRTNKKFNSKQFSEKTLDCFDLTSNLS